MSRDQHSSNKKQDSEKIVYANMGEDAIRPRIPLDQSSSTTVEVGMIVELGLILDNAKAVAPARQLRDVEIGSMTLVHRYSELAQNAIVVSF